MKNLLVILFLSLSLSSSAQTVELVKRDVDIFRSSVYPATICYDPEYLAAISDTMFREGNPKYIWVDLLKDMYISDRDAGLYSLYVTLKGEKKGGNVHIPDEARQQYADKWKSFVEYIREPQNKYDYYSFSLYPGLNSDDIVNPNSAFRKTDKAELHHLHLTSRGQLRFLNELVKDGLAPLDKAINLEFSKNGFYVHNKRLSRELREKYMNICKEEFGHNYYNDQSSFKCSALPENILSEDITELTTRINAAENNSDNK